MGYPERQWLEHEISQRPHRKAAFKKLYSSLCEFPVVEARDVSIACDDWVELIFRYEEISLNTVLGGYNGFWSEHATYHREQWKVHGFSIPTIRSVTLDYLSHTGMKTDLGMKTFLSLCLHRCDMNLPENEALWNVFGEQIDPGAFSTKEDAQDFVAFIADQSDEMFIKRKVDAMQFRLITLDDQPEVTVSAFLQSPFGNQLGEFSTIEWFTHDDHSKGRSGRYADLARDAFNDVRNTRAYQEFLTKSYKDLCAEFYTWQSQQG